MQRPRHRTKQARGPASQAVATPGTVIRTRRTGSAPCRRPRVHLVSTTTGCASPQQAVHRCPIGALQVPLDATRPTTRHASQSAWQQRWPRRLASHVQTPGARRLSSYLHRPCPRAIALHGPSIPTWPTTLSLLALAPFCALPFPRRTLYCYRPPSALILVEQHVGYPLDHGELAAALGAHQRPLLQRHLKQCAVEGLLEALVLQ